MTNLRKQRFAISLSLERLFRFFLFFSLNYPQIYGQHREHINLYQMAPGRHVYSNKYQTTTSNRCILLAGCNSLIIHSLTGRNESFSLSAIILVFFFGSLSVCAILLVCYLGFGKNKTPFYHASWLDFKMNPLPQITLQLLY